MKRLERVELDLKYGFLILCANISGCSSEINDGDEYVMKGRYMYCCQECADEDPDVEE